MGRVRNVAKQRGRVSKIDGEIDEIDVNQRYAGTSLIETTYILGLYLDQPDTPMVPCPLTMQRTR